jgi:elongation factor G
MQDLVDTEREALIENVAEADDELIERYLEGEAISDEDIRAALHKGLITRTFSPVLCGSATRSIGIDLLMDFFAASMPSPQARGPRKGIDPASGQSVERTPDPEAPFSGFVFKTIADPYAGRLSIFRVVSGRLSGDGNLYNATKECRERYNQLLTIAGKEQKPVTEAGPGTIVAFAKLKETTTGDTLCDESAKIRFECVKSMPTLISFALVPKSKGDEDKIFSSLTKLLEEDPGLKVDRNAETSEILLSGMGQVHIEATIEKLKRKYNVEVHLNTPKIPYRETIKKKVRVQGRHKKQTGGHGQFGDCWIQMEPLPRGEGLQFVDAIVGGAIPKTYIPAVEKGVQESARRGVLAGFPCVDFKVTLDDGSFHAVDSSEMAFKIAGSLAFKKAAEDAKPVLLEPIMSVTITTPDEFMGDIMGDLNGRRGRVLGMDSEGKYQVIKAQVPMAEFLTYAPDLNSMTGGRGLYTMEFSHYDEMPAQLAEKVIEAALKEKG